MVQYCILRPKQRIDNDDSCCKRWREFPAAGQIPLLYGQVIICFHFLLDLGGHEIRKYISRIGSSPRTGTPGLVYLRLPRKKKVIPESGIPNSMQSGTIIVVQYCILRPKQRIVPVVVGRAKKYKLTMEWFCRRICTGWSFQVHARYRLCFLFCFAERSIWRYG